MENIKTIATSDFLALWTTEPNGSLFIDARSPKEFQAGALPFFESTPLLSDESRHQIGLAYKNRGKEEAIALGMALEGGNKEKIQASVLNLIKTTRAKKVFVTCWRGGLRSQILTSLIQEVSDIPAYQIEGGYKSIRNSLLGLLKNLPEFVVLSGTTGSGKTTLLNKYLDRGAVDLEACANHRGSSFGYNLDRSQPSQSTFENYVLYEMTKFDKILIEDESRLIGKIVLPSEIKEKMKVSDVVLLKESLETRVSHLFEEYILEPLKTGTSKEKLLNFYLERLKPLSKKLGGGRYLDIKNEIEEAFASDNITNIARHEVYLKRLLTTYYDRSYLHAFNQYNRKVVFTGNSEECETWLNKTFPQDQSDSHKPSKKAAVPPSSPPANLEKFSRA